MKKFISLLIIGVIAYVGFKNYHEIEQLFKKNDSQTIKQAANQTAVLPTQAASTSKVKPVNQSKPRGIFAGIPQQITETKPAAKNETQDKPVDSSPESSLKKPATGQMLGLLQVLRRDGRLSFSNEYQVTGEDRKLYQDYQQIQNKLNQKLKGQHPTMSEIKQYRSNYDSQLEKLARKYKLNKTQLEQFVKTVKKLL